MTDFIKADSQSLTRILAHVHNSAVMELLLSLLRAEGSPDGRGMVKASNPDDKNHRITTLHCSG